MKPFNKTTLSDIQRKQFELMSEREKELVRKGHPTKIISTETGEGICSFNEHNFEVPKEALDSFARAILPDVVEYYAKGTEAGESNQEDTGDHTPESATAAC